MPVVEAAAFVHHEHRRGDVDSRQGEVDHGGDPGPDHRRRGAGVLEEGVEPAGRPGDGGRGVPWSGRDV
ncbi:hypothetical protein GCM10017776_61720 [Streptomyces griseoluteus]|nr:hypothetical protein GCM10017776_61720 [Streptomyces griseoluteus]